jgi:hypothetical protein
LYLNKFQPVPARTDLENLVHMGFLQIIDLNKKTKGFSKADVFDATLAKGMSPNLIS